MIDGPRRTDSAGVENSQRAIGTVWGGKKPACECRAETARLLGAGEGEKKSEVDDAPSTPKC